MVPPILEKEIFCCGSLTGVAYADQAPAVATEKTRLSERYDTTTNSHMHEEVARTPLFRQIALFPQRTRERLSSHKDLTR